MDDCVFCKIIKGEIPSNKVYEDDKFFAFLDIAPINYGHTLVIPKEHHRTLMDMPEDLLKEFFIVTRKIAKAVKEATNADGFNIGINNEKAAGQLVFHTHAHIIPRFSDDGLVHWGSKKYDENNKMEDFQNKIKEKLER